MGHGRRCVGVTGGACGRLEAHAGAPPDVMGAHLLIFPAHEGGCPPYQAVRKHLHEAVAPLTLC